MKITFYLAFIIAMFPIGLSAQDILILTTGQESQVLIKKVGVSTIEYVRFDNQTGPVYEVNKTDVHKVKYSNGVEDLFNPLALTENATEKISEFIDERDNTKYKYVVIGEQTWMAENLNYKIGNSLCYKDSNDLCDDCGRFYTYDEAVKVCPEGWHLPSDKEWMNLETEIGMYESDAASIGWRGSKPGQAPFILKGGYTGLDLNMCGYLWTNGTPKDDPKYNGSNLREGAYYWTSTTYKANNNAYYRHLEGRKSIFKETWSKLNRLTIRCIKD